MQNKNKKGCAIALFNPPIIHPIHAGDRGVAGQHHSRTAEVIGNSKGVAMRSTYSSSLETIAVFCPLHQNQKDETDVITLEQM